MIELFDFQQETVKTILAKYKDQKLRAGIFAEMGTGKTPMAMEIINKLELKHLFIVCPQDSIKAWEGALSKFNLEKKYGVWIFDKPAKVNYDNIQHLLSELNAGQSFLVIFTYLGYSASLRMQNLMDPLWEKIKELPQDTGIILDESHSIKNNKAKVTKQFNKLARKLDEVKLKLLLTGTPHPNFLYEVYPQLQFLESRPISYCPSYWSFYTMHTEIIDRNNFKIEKGNRLEDKAMEEIQKYVVYVAKNDVLDVLKLEKLISSDIVIEMSERNKELYKMAKELIDIVKYDIRTLTLEQLKRLPTYDYLAYMHGNKSRALSYMRQILADSFESVEISTKIPVLQDLLQDGKPTIVYTPFIKSIGKLTEVFQFLNPLVIIGNTSMPSDIETNIRPLLLTTQSKLKQGLNLQGYKRIVYYSNDWSLINRMQSEARIHRFGQADEVEIINLIYKNTMEERIVGLLKNKQMANKIIIDLFKSNKPIDNFS